MNDMLNPSTWTPVQAFVAGVVTYFLFSCVWDYIRGFAKGVIEELKRK